jgi:hypothetical protein
MKNIINIIFLIISTNQAIGQTNQIGFFYNNSVPVHSVDNKMGMLNFSTVGLDFYRHLSDKFSIGIGGQYQVRNNKWSIGHYEGTNGVTFSFMDKFNTLNIDLLAKFLFLNTNNKFNIYAQSGISSQLYFTENVPLLIFKDLKITEQSIDKKITLRNFAYLGVGLIYKITKSISIEPNVFGKLFLNPKKEVIYTNTNLSSTSTSASSGYGTTNTVNQHGFNIKIGFSF